MSNMKRSRYHCPECGLWYKEAQWAGRCEAWCKKHKSCNLDIMEHAEVRSEDKGS